MKSTWLFGYGSLVWRPAFPWRQSRPAFLRGHVRRFWQGSTDHRGRPGHPGRVVTLVSEAHPSVIGEASRRNPPCWGRAYEISAKDVGRVLAGLDHRERGGYERLEVELTLSDDRVTGLVYVAGPDNENYLGEAPIASIAHQVANAAGPSGPNREYVFELERALRAMGAEDEYVFAVALELRRILSRSDEKLNLSS